MPVEGPRALAFETLRETFERHAHTELVFRAGAERLGLVGRDRAQAQRLAYGSVQRRGTSDAAIERLSGRAMRLLDPPVAAALRLGLYELLFADGTPDHAAVDQAVELVKIAKAGHASGFVNAILRRAAREREELTAALLGDDSTPEAAATAHSAPLWLARMWWRSSAPRRRGRCSPPATSPPRWRCGRPTRRRAPTWWRGCGARASTSRRPAAGWPLAVPEAMVFAGRVGDLVPTLVKEGALTPQSRGSAAVVEALAPRAGETVLDLCAGPGIKTGQIAKRMEDRGEIVSVELDEQRAAEVAAQATRLDLHSVSVFEGDATDVPLPEGFDRILLDAPCSDLGTLASRPDARWRKSPRIDRAGRGGAGEGAAELGQAAAAGRHARLLDLHDLAARERGPDRGAARSERRRPGAAARAGRPRCPGAGARLAPRAPHSAAAPRP